MEIASNTKIIRQLSKILNKITQKIFYNIIPDGKSNNNIIMNIIANILGLGNAATPLGIKAIKSLQEENRNKEELSNSMVMFIVLNTASIQIIPTTIIAIRASMGAKNPSSIIVPSCIASLVALLIGILVVKALSKKGVKKWIL